MGRKSRPYPAKNGWRFTFNGKKYWRKRESDAWVMLARLEASSANSAERSPLTVASLIERWEAENDVDPSQHAHEMLEEFSAWAGRTALDEISPSILSDFKAHLSRRKSRQVKKGSRSRKQLGLETIRKKVMHAARVLRWAVKREWIALLPDIPKLEKPSPRPKALSQGQIVKLMTELAESKKRKNVVPLIRFMLETGCRPGEARTLEWRCVDLEHCVAVLDDHKTARRTGEARIIPLSATAISIIESVQGRNDKHVFVNRLGKPYTRNGLAAILRRRGVSQYQLRHTWCQVASDKGIPEEVIRKIMGHRTSRMVEMYRRISDERVRSATALLDGLSEHAPSGNPARALPRDSKDSA